MLENKACHSLDKSEAICIDANRIYDSCCDKDCLADLQVVFTEGTQNIIDCATSVRCRKAEIVNVCIDVEPVQFNRGCYSVDITFFFKVYLDVFTSPSCSATKVCGLATYSKKCILYGSDGNVKVFSSDSSNSYDDKSVCGNSTPVAKVQCVDPVVLDAKLCKVCECKCYCKCETHIPNCVSNCFDGELCCRSESENAVLVTLGLFCIVQLERNVQMKIPSYDFCIPQKECNCNNDDPCDSFNKIRFPLDEFFPPNQCKINKSEKSHKDFGCNCGCKK